MTSKQPRPFSARSRQSRFYAWISCLLLVFTLTCELRYSNTEKLLQVRGGIVIKSKDSSTTQIIPSWLSQSEQERNPEISAKPDRANETNKTATRQKQNPEIATKQAQVSKVTTETATASSSKTSQETPLATQEVQDIIKTSTSSPQTSGETPQKVDSEIDTSQGVGGKNTKMAGTMATKKKPYFVLHVGPGKTGTSSTQCALRSLKNELLRDNFVIYNTHSCSAYEATHPKTRIWECLKNRGGNPLPKCMEFYFDEFRNITASGKKTQSIIISEEFLYPVEPTFSSFVEHLNEDYQVVVIATYRHFFERTISFHTQRFKHLVEWPDLSSSSLNDVLSTIRKEMKQVQIDPFKQVTDDAMSSSSSFRLLNFHADPLVANFLCFGLPDAPSACKSIQTQSTINKKNVGTQEYMFDALAIEARKQNLIPRDFPIKRQEASKLLASRLKVTDFTKLPLICLSNEEEEEFWGITKRMALEIFKYQMVDGSSVDLKELHAEFKNASQSGLWCRIDASKLLADKNWKDRILFALKSKN